MEKNHISEQERNPKEKVCFNCLTRETPLWRRSKKGANLCNACGLYYKNHGEHRPMNKSMIYQNQPILDHRYNRNLDILERIAVTVLAEMKLKANVEKNFNNERLYSVMMRMTGKMDSTTDTLMDSVVNNNSCNNSCSNNTCNTCNNNSNRNAIQNYWISNKMIDKTVKNNKEIPSKATKIADSVKINVNSIIKNENGVVFGDLVKIQKSGFIPVIKEYFSNDQKDVKEAIDKLRSFTEQ